MYKHEREAFDVWTIAYAESPAANPSGTSYQKLAIQIHELMADGQKRTSAAIAHEMGVTLTKIRNIMPRIAQHWGYEVSKSCNDGGYRRL